MEDNPITKATKLPPKQLALIAVGGIGLGLAWRYFQNRNSSNTTVSAPTDVASVPVDTTLPLPTVGNLGSGSSSGTVDSGTGSGGTVDSGTRDVGSITLPVVKWVVTIGGKQYLTDGDNIEPIPSSEPTPTPTPTPAPTPAPAPAPTPFVVPSYKGVVGASPSDPLAWAYIRAQLDYPNETPQQWWNRAVAQRGGK